MNLNYTPIIIIYIYSSQGPGQTSATSTTDRHRDNISKCNQNTI